MSVAVEFEHVGFAYVRGQPVLRDIDLTVGEGEFVAIAGPNGGGKTTLLRLALGLEQPSRGQVCLFGERADRFSNRAILGYLAQRTNLAVQAPATVREVVAAGRAARNAYGRLRRDDKAAIEEAIERVGMTRVANRPLTRLSGGQVQRALIAKALAAEPKLLALDRLYRAGLAHCARRDFVTSHAAFGYLAARYHLHQIPITGIDPESEPSPQRLQALIELVRHEHIHTVFFERLVSPRLAETIARDAGAQARVLDPIEGLTPAEQRQGQTYLTLMRQNLGELRAALGCR